MAESEAAKTRVLTLDEYDEKGGDSMLLLLNNSYWHDPVTEKPAVNSTEIWSFLNRPTISHPIHLHAVRFQILDRQRYDPWTYNTKNELRLLGRGFHPPRRGGLEGCGARHAENGDAYHREI